MVAKIENKVVRIENKLARLFDLSIFNFNFNFIARCKRQFRPSSRTDEYL